MLTKPNSEQERIRFLWDTGHFANPAFPETFNVEEDQLVHLTEDDSVVKDAITSFQEIDQNTEHLSQLYHSRPIQFDGLMGPATQATMNLDRCSIPDYVRPEDPDHDIEEASATVWNLPGCNPKHSDRNSVRCVRCFIDDSRATDSWKQDLPWIKQAAQSCANEVGIRIDWINNIQNAEFFLKFERIPGGVIGWNQLPPGGTNICNVRMNGRLDNSYVADRYMRATLTIHEAFGHGFGHGHTRGGIMNPSILRVDANDKGFPTWLKGNSGNRTARNRFLRWFGVDEFTAVSPLPPDQRPDPPTLPDPDPNPIDPTNAFHITSPHEAPTVITFNGKTFLPQVQPDRPIKF